MLINFRIKMHSVLKGKQQEKEKDTKNDKNCIKLKHENGIPN